MRGVSDSAYHWYGESATPRITDTRSRRLPVSLIWGVADSPHRWYGESAIASLPCPFKGTWQWGGFYNFLLDVDFSYFAADHGLINYIENKAKGCHLKKFTCKGTLRQVFIRIYRPQTNKHLPQSPFTGQFFRWQHFAILLWCLYS